LETGPTLEIRDQVEKKIERSVKKNSGRREENDTYLCFHEDESMNSVISSLIPRPLHKK
jgi:hypothetical protein